MPDAQAVSNAMQQAIEAARAQGIKINPSVLKAAQQFGAHAPDMPDLGNVSVACPIPNGPTKPIPNGHGRH
jgi:L-lactate permease